MKGRRWGGSSIVTGYNMNYIGGIEGMNFKPIASYNGYLKNNAAFNVNDGVDFESVLNSKTSEINSNQPTLKSGVQMNTNFDDIMAQNANMSSENPDSAGALLNSFSKSMGGGLNSLNDLTVAANKAQEDFAMGKDVSVHDVMIASEKASLGLQMAVQLRNKLMSAYTEINNVRV